MPVARRYYRQAPSSSSDSSPPCQWSRDQSRLQQSSTIQVFLFLAVTAIPVTSPNKWSVTQNLLYALVILVIIALTVGAIWLASRLMPRRHRVEIPSTHLQEIRLAYEETLSTADRMVVRDQQTRGAAHYMSRDPSLAQPLEQWREKRCEWVAQLTFLEALTPNLSKMPANPVVVGSLRYMHTLAFGLKAAQHAILRAVRQAVATGSKDPPLGTASDTQGQFPAPTLSKVPTAGDPESKPGS